MNTSELNPNTLASPLRAWRRALLLAPLLTLACNQPPPPGSTDSAEDTSDGSNLGDTSGDGTDTTGAPGDTGDTGDTGEPTDTTETDTGNSDPGVFADTLYPLADGATWTYIAKNINGQVLGMEVVDTVELEWDGQPAFLLTDNVNASGEWTESVLIKDGSLSTRIHKEIKSDAGTVMIVDYDPGFARVDDTWNTQGFSTELFYDRTEYDGDGLNPSLEARAHIFTVIAVDEQVTVPAGTFDCVQIERVRSLGTKAGERVISWYAFGIGKIREERPADSRIEELASVSIPGGVQLP